MIAAPMKVVKVLKNGSKPVFKIFQLRDPPETPPSISLKYAQGTFGFIFQMSRRFHEAAAFHAEGREAPPIVVLCSALAAGHTSHS
jgi:hypothetical protein